MSNRTIIKVKPVVYTTRERYSTPLRKKREYKASREVTRMIQSRAYDNTCNKLTGVFDTMADRKQKKIWLAS